MTTKARPQPTASDRVHRILGEVLWISEQDGPTVAEAAGRFGLSETTLMEDLGLATMIGSDSDDYLDMPVDMWVEGERVFVNLRAFDRPLRLTPAEALSLVVAGLALTGASPDPDSSAETPLASALTKLAGVLGVEVGQQVDVEMGVGDACVFAALREAVDTHRAVEIDHLRISTDTRLKRVVEPWGLFHDRGAWYLSGYCRTAEDERVFRVDRIVDATVLDETVEPPPAAPSTTALRADAGAPRIVLDLEADAHWVVESYPVEKVEVREDGTLRVTLVVASREWIQRLLLRVGPDAVVVELDEPLGPSHPGAVAAKRILARYGSVQAQG